MIVASFLIHDLGLDWRLGAAHFEELLLDADVASNRGNWLWVVKNSHRIFNPTLQAKNLAEYVARWVTPDGAYPAPIVDHDEVIRRKRHGRSR